MIMTHDQTILMPSLNCMKIGARGFFVLLVLFLSVACESSHRLRPMTVGFQECELIFSVHDRCMQIDEEKAFTFTFQADHAGVSFGQDNLSLSASDFSLEDTHGCHFTQEYRISYQAEPSPAPDFQWTILEGNKSWTVFPVKLRECGF